MTDKGTCRGVPTGILFALETGKTILLFSLCILLLAGCKERGSHPDQIAGKQTDPLRFTDSLGREVTLTHRPERVIALSASFAETWMLSGGSLVGTTSDSHTRKTFTLSEDVRTIGTIKDPNSEAIIALEPDLVLLTTEIPSHLALSPLLTECRIPHAYFHVERVEDYLFMLQACTTLTGRKDLYQTNGLDTLKGVQRILANHKDPAQTNNRTYLLLRSYSTKIRAKGGDNMVSTMLDELGYTNLTDLHPSLLEELSMESIVWEEPSYIFVIPMGDEQAAQATMDHLLATNKAFAALKAVKGGRYHLLPKNLFHYKPNNRWGESYAYLAKLLAR